MLTVIVVIVVIVILVLLVLAYAYMKPSTMHIERRMTVSASPEAVFPFINDFHNWTVWSPWERMDPGLKRAYTGAHSGRGAVYEWDGNKKVGSGRMEIIDTAAPERIVVKLDFIRPFEGHNISTFGLKPVSQGTEIIWAMDGPSPFMMRVMGIVMNMDKLIGKDFESGLANLKAAAER